MLLMAVLRLLENSKSKEKEVVIKIEKKEEELTEKFPKS